MPAIKARLQKIRCANVITKKYWDGSKRETCGRLLVAVVEGKGESVCPRCGHLTKWEVQSS